MACKKFDEALKIKKNDFKTLKNYAVTLSKLARLKKG